MTNETVTREQFLKNQKQSCDKNDWPHFMPSNGICWGCRGDMIPALIDKGQDGNNLVTGCPLCCKSYCD